MKSIITKVSNKKTGNWKLQTSNLSGFTLVEMIVSITIFSIIIIVAFESMSNIGIFRTRLSSRLDLNNELYSATEKFVDLIKTGGDIDYEEYWNRKIVGTATLSGHYTTFSGFGNYGSGSGYGDGLYYCISGSGAKMGTGGCVEGSNTYGNSVSLNGSRQRYGEYRQQFIDYNANANYDSGGLLGDEDGNGKIQGDDDDEDTGIGPSAFSGGVGMKELYLMKKGSQSERTYFRWILKNDPNSPPGATCDFSNGSGSGCLGNIQILRLSGKDIGISHSGAISSSGRYDGIIDTWECHPDYNCTGANNLPLGADTEWVDIFPDWIHVKSVDFFPYPEKNFKYAWRESNDNLTINSYVRIRLTLGLSWEKRRKITGPSSDMTLITTVNLSR